jgi:hypothetical protein
LSWDKWLYREHVSGLQSENEEETVTTNVSAMGQDGSEKEKGKEKEAEKEKEGKEKKNKTRRHRYTGISEKMIRLVARGGLWSVGELVRVVRWNC